MKTSNRRVIKSVEVKYLPVSKDTAAGLSPAQGSVNRSSPSGGTGRTSLPDRIRDAYEKKFQIAEQKAYDRGVNDGIRQGRELQKNEALQTVQAAAAMVTEVASLKQHILGTLENQIIELSFSIAGKIIHLEVTANREVIRNVLKDAMRNIVDRESMKVRLHPQDFHYMMEIKADFLQGFDGIKNIVFEEDGSVQRGGALIETLCGEVDARLDQQFNEIKKLMTSPECASSH